MILIQTDWTFLSSVPSPTPSIPEPTKLYFTRNFNCLEVTWCLWFVVRGSLLICDPLSRIVGLAAVRAQQSGLSMRFVAGRREA